MIFKKIKKAKSPFWINEVYGLGYWLKDYAYYPQKFPLFCYMDHGVALYDTIPPHEKENNAPVIFKYSRRLVKEFRKASDKPVYCLMNPTIHCRNKKKIKQNPDAKGTLFFPAHSTDSIDDDTDWIKFIENLKSVTNHFNPIDICLHYWDMKKGIDKIFINNGFKVLSAGDPFDIKFPENMYMILKNYRFTMSNLPGSYTFYSVEMGIPFSLFGSEPKYLNKGDANMELGAYTSYKEQATFKIALTLFSGLFTEITPEQKKFVNFELGKHHSISRIKASFLLYRALIQYYRKYPDYFKNPVK